MALTVESTSSQICILIAVDAVALTAAVHGIFVIAPIPTVMLNFAILLCLNKPKAGDMISEMKSLPALAAAGAIVVEVSGSRIKLMDLLSSSSNRHVSLPFRRAMALCYRGSAVDDVVREASGELPFSGIKQGLMNLEIGGKVDSIGGQAAMSALDLNRYYTSAIGTLETRLSVVQGISFFLPMLVLISFSRFFAGPFDALVTCSLSFSSLRFVVAMAVR